ncbi:aminopeptidase P N-terminal domain-containing protein [Sulfurimonas sp.]|uniref:aminopeptidase P N-terminal domain-containing protein n=1 Tax=Sulfurimonas sp. TaxID=2022749 RepID=UPI00260E5B9B|nr:aminopeptidase P N-terminal domain-containing protein [Sulfurimonas sp.]
MIYEKEYAKRRQSLMQKLKKKSIAVLFSAEQKIRSNDTEYPYRQDSNFYYLSGFTEDNAALVFVRAEEEMKSYLFVAKKVEAKELWSGARLGVEAAKESFDVDDVFAYEDFSEKFKELAAGKSRVYYDFKLDYSKVKLLKKYSQNIVSFENLALGVEKLRLIKSPAEIELIKKALEITKEAHHRAMRKSKKLDYEYQLQAEIEYVFKKNGAYSDAYTSIVACGNAANTLHYINNDKELLENELILIDAGCEYQYYASDITRTIPVNGRFTQAQKELYQLVLDVEKKIISMIRAGVLRSDLQKKSEELLCAGMVKLGILHGNVSELIEAKMHKKYYPHGIGHWMGIDVHDQCPYRDKNDKEIPLRAGMVMTIEPGLYLSTQKKSVPKKYRGIGIRIEDDILVTQNGCENLSSAIAKEIKEIESLSS